MKIVRTFNPIGQGAFYSERFYEGAECNYNVVYDCGVLNVGSRHKRFVQQSFTKKDRIDYLFISHLDEDHISLVTTLRNSVGFIRRVVLPYISPGEVMIHKILAQSLGLTEVYGFWSMVADAIDGGINDDMSFLFVSPNDEVTNHANHNHLIYSGTQLSSNCPDWVFIPYNKHAERKTELEDNLKELVQNRGFQKALRQIGVTIHTVEDLKNKITNADFADLVSSQAIREYLKGAYKEITGTINQNSLLVYSGPADENGPYRIDLHAFCPFEIKSLYRLKFCEYCLSYSFSRKHVACLYTGDSDLDMKGYKQEFQDLWNNVGTIQLPHHGSYASFQFDKNKDEFDKLYVFPVSCGETNPYGHPSSKVLDFLKANNSLPLVVTENASTRYSQVIVRRH